MDMMRRRWTVIAALALACAPGEGEEEPAPCSLEALISADQALAAREDGEARRRYEELAACEGERDEGAVVEPARAGLGLLAADAPATIAVFLQHRNFSNPALDVVIDRLRGAPEAHAKLCEWLDERAEPQDRGQHVRCLERMDPPADRWVLRAALARLSMLTPSDVMKIAALEVSEECIPSEVDDCRGPIHACLAGETPPSAPSCQDPFPAGALSRLALQASRAWVFEYEEGLDDGQGAERARCLRRVGLEACLRAIEEGCGCEGWRGIHAAIWDQIQIPRIDAVKRARDKLGLSGGGRQGAIKVGGRPWQCDDAMVKDLAETRGDDARALRLLHVSFAQFREAAEDATEGGASEDVKCAQRLTCALGDPEVLRRALPMIQHPPCRGEIIPASGIAEPSSSIQAHAPRRPVAARCGDGIRDGNEACDDGNMSNTDSCTNACELARCGDEFKQPGEQCDPPGALSPRGERCSDICRWEFCGDGDVSLREECDDGNTIDEDSCTNACEWAKCGDKFKQPGEQCDPPGVLSPSGETCSKTCTWVSQFRCGDGKVNGREECDDGPKNNNTGACTLACKKARCGDGFRQAGEQCDDGRLNGRPGRCRKNCTNQAPPGKG